MQLSFLGGNSNAPTIRHGEPFSQKAPGQKTTPIAPKPSGSFRPHSNTFDSSSISLPAATSPGSARRVYNFTEGAISPTSPIMEPPPPSSAQSQKSRPQKDPKTQSQTSGLKKKSIPTDNRSHYNFDALTRADGTPRPFPPSDGSRRPSKASIQNVIHDLPRKLSAPADFYQSTADSAWDPSRISHDTFTPSTSSAADTLQSVLDTVGQTGRLEHTTLDHDINVYRQGLMPLPKLSPHSEWNISQPWPLDQHQIHAMDEDEDEDPFDVSDEDVEMAENTESGVWQEAAQDDHLRSNDLGIVVALQANQDGHGASLRSFTSFIDRPDMLATYIPSSQSTPLRDPMTARIFCHFVNVTAPCISMFERHPANPSLIFQGEPVPKTQQHMWTCGFC